MYQPTYLSTTILPSYVSAAIPSSTHRIAAFKLASWTSHLPFLKLLWSPMPYQPGHSKAAAFSQGVRMHISVYLASVVSLARAFSPLP